jgi:mono/diheme cytochrome c family protein
VKKLLLLLIAILVAGFAVVSCSSKQGTSSSTSSQSTMSSSASSGNMGTVSSSSTMAGSSMAGSSMAASKLPIPLAKLPSLKVAPGNATAGAAVFSANCASCHGAGGKNGQVGPTLAGAGLKAGQVAYMVRNPQGVDKASGMPKLPLTDKQVADVAAYVASLK